MKHQTFRLSTVPFVLSAFLLANGSRSRSFSVAIRPHRKISRAFALGGKKTPQVGSLTKRCWAIRVRRQRLNFGAAPCSVAAIGQVRINVTPTTPSQMFRSKDVLLRKEVAGRSLPVLPFFPVRYFRITAVVTYYLSLTCVSHFYTSNLSSTEFLL